MNKQKIKRKKEDLNFRLSCNLRGRLCSAIRGNYKAGSAVHDLGCSIDFLKLYLKRKFYGKMTWKNYGKLWVIDHIVPLFKFDLTNRKQFLKACNYKNLQPLTEQEHVIKTTKEIQEFWKNK